LAKGFLTASSQKRLATAFGQKYLGQALHLIVKADRAIPVGWRDGEKVGNKKQCLGPQLGLSTPRPKRRPSGCIVFPMPGKRECLPQLATMVSAKRQHLPGGIALARQSYR